MPNKIPIVHIIHTSAIGGAEILLYDLLTRIDRETFSPHLIMIYNKQEAPTLYDDLEIPIIKLYRQPKTLGLKMVQQIVTYLKKHQAQIVHTHLFGGDTWGRIAAILANTPIIISTEHSINTNETLIHQVIKKILVSKTNIVIAISEAVKNYSIRVDHIPSQKIKVIYNGIDLQKFQAQKINKSPFPTLISVGRLHNQKGYEYLLKSMTIVKNHFPKVKLQIVGTGEEEQELKKIAQSENLENNVNFLGFRKDVPRLLAQSHLFVLSSIYEGLGLVILEAMATGIPVVATEVGGIPEIITHKENGILVPSRNPEKLAEAIIKILEDKSLANKMVRKGLETVKNKYDIMFMVKAYENLYKRLIIQNEQK